YRHCAYSRVHSLTVSPRLIAIHYLRISLASESNDRKRTLPRAFSIRPEARHLLRNRVASNKVTAEASANSSLLISTSIPFGTLPPTIMAMLLSTAAHLCWPVKQVSAAWEVRNHPR